MTWEIYLRFAPSRAAVDVVAGQGPVLGSKREAASHECGRSEDMYAMPGQVATCLQCQDYGAEGRRWVLLVNEMRMAIQTARDEQTALSTGLLADTIPPPIPTSPARATVSTNYGSLTHASAVVSDHIRTKGTVGQAIPEEATTPKVIIDLSTPRSVDRGPTSSQAAPMSALPAQTSASLPSLLNPVESSGGSERKINDSPFLLKLPEALNPKKIIHLSRPTGAAQASSSLIPRPNNATEQSSSATRVEAPPTISIDVNRRAPQQHPKYIAGQRTVQWLKANYRISKTGHEKQIAIHDHYRLSIPQSEQLLGQELIRMIPHCFKGVTLVSENGSYSCMGIERIPFNPPPQSTTQSQIDPSHRPPIPALPPQHDPQVTAVTPFPLSPPPVSSARLQTAVRSIPLSAISANMPGSSIRPSPSRPTWAVDNGPSTSKSLLEEIDELEFLPTPKRRRIDQVLIQPGNRMRVSGSPGFEILG
ncbi:hypothetical protein P7C73_g676, partial [Tremellales sp. Uapishka_1]